MSNGFSHWNAFVEDFKKNHPEYIVIPKKKTERKQLNNESDSHKELKELDKENVSAEG